MNKRYFYFLIILTFSFYFSCSDAPTSSNDDGNEYQTVAIGAQVWMSENLKVTHYRNGDAIPNVTDGGTWWGLSTGAYCNYNNDKNKVATYGRLYNWYAVNDSRNIAPVGWHVATNADWQTLVDFLGGNSVAGGKMKENGTTHWASPNIGATNESGFSALPGGFYAYNGDAMFTNFGLTGNWWSSTEFNSTYAWCHFLDYHYSDIFVDSYFNKRDGLSVRCVKD